MLQSILLLLWTYALATTYSSYLHFLLLNHLLLLLYLLLLLLKHLLLLFLLKSLHQHHLLFFGELTLSSRTTDLHSWIRCIYISSCVTFSDENIRGWLSRITLGNSFHLHLVRDILLCCLLLDNIMRRRHLLLLLLIVVLLLRISWSTSKTFISCISHLHVHFGLLLTFIQWLVIIIIHLSCVFLTCYCSHLLSLVAYHWSLSNSSCVS